MLLVLTALLDGEFIWAITQYQLPKTSFYIPAGTDTGGPRHQGTSQAPAAADFASTSTLVFLSTTSPFRRLVFCLHCVHSFASVLFSLSPSIVFVPLSVCPIIWPPSLGDSSTAPSLSHCPRPGCHNRQACPLLPSFHRCLTLHNYNPIL